MARVGLHGKVEGQNAKSSEFIPVLAYLFDLIESNLNRIDSTQLADYVAGSSTTVTTAKISDLAVTAAKIALLTITPAQTADGVGQTTSVSYTGDGTTANRVITLGFTPRWVKIVRTDATFIEFESVAVGGSVAFWYRVAAGTQGADTANFQGITTNGVKLGTSAVGTSNVAAVVYHVVAWK